ncbi:DUF1294 domain-containing protein [Ruegeria pomeroyi]|nr:DUF1294 domain-containing protein [Ruegeria pomeroyi]
MWNAILYLWVLNGLTVALFAWDKLSARWSRGRVPEHLLLWLSALGGSPAALLSRWLFRHKTRKQPFGRWLWSIVLFQITVLVILLGKDLL